MIQSLAVSYSNLVNTLPYNAMQLTNKTTNPTQQPFNRNTKPEPPLSNGEIFLTWKMKTFDDGGGQKKNNCHDMSITYMPLTVHSFAMLAIRSLSPYLIEFKWGQFHTLCALHWIVCQYLRSRDTHLSQEEPSFDDDDDGEEDTFSFCSALAAASAGVVTSVSSPHVPSSSCGQ